MHGFMVISEESQEWRFYRNRCWSHVLMVRVLQSMLSERSGTLPKRMNGEENIETLPSNLLEAISSKGGGRVTLVLGAGCSNEEPTSLPLASDLSEESHRKLVADHILRPGEVIDPRDLSAVAEAVFEKTGSQQDLTNRFPMGAFRLAAPNEGYLIMAALLIEGALSDTLTLNFDHAALTALANLGAGPKVSTVMGPGEHAQIGAKNLIYLHRDINSPPDEIILRTAQLDEESWHEHWEQVVVQRVLSGPITVFAGLGSPASVLVETTKRIIKAIDKAQARFYVVDPSPRENSKFASQLDIAPGDYLCMGWGDFMHALAERVVEEHRAAVERDCGDLSRDLGIETEDVADLCGRLAGVGLLGLGRLRAAWMLDSGSYLPYEQGAPLHNFSHLVLAIRLVERVSGRRARFDEDGVVEFSQGGYVTRVMACSSGGWMNGARIEVELSKRREAMQRQGKAPSVALVWGVGYSLDMATPSDIVGDSDPNDLVTGPAYLRMVSISDLRADPDLVQQMFR